jgi:hypothetical protein
MRRILRFCLGLMAVATLAPLLAPAPAHAMDRTNRMVIAAFEDGVDPRWSQAVSSSDITISTPLAAWTPAQPDNINYWDVTSDKDAVNESADQILNLSYDLDLRSYDRLAALFYTDVYTITSDAHQVLSPANGKIQLLLYDRSAPSQPTPLGFFADTGATQNAGRWSLAGVPAAMRDQVFAIGIRVDESAFGAVAPSGQTMPLKKLQRTHLYSLAAEVAPTLAQLTVADFEGGLDPRGSLVSHGMVTQGPSAWLIGPTPIQDDFGGISWDVTSNGSRSVDYVDYELKLAPLTATANSTMNWMPYTKLKIKFWTSCPAPCTSAGAIRPIIHDRDGPSTALGVFHTSDRDAEGRIMIDLSAILDRDEIDLLTIRISETDFVNLGVSGATQSTTLTDLELITPTAHALPALLASSAVMPAITRANTYDYAPSVMKDGNTYKMWWCSSRYNVMGSDNDQVWDVIRYAESSDGITWPTWTPTNQPPIVLAVTPSSPETNGASDGHACDPSVIKVNGTYYMYYTAAGPTPDQCTSIPRLNHCPPGYQPANQIFLATSTDGLTWTKYRDPMTHQPKPVVANTYAPPTYYGLGQPTAMYLYGRFYLYYSDGLTYPIGRPDGWASTKLKISHTGLFNDTGPGAVVFSDLDFVPTYHKDLGAFVAVTASDIDGAPRVKYYFSENGTRWTHDFPTNAPWITVSDRATDVENNPAILTDPHGLAFDLAAPDTLPGTIAVYYATGSIDPVPDSLTWDIKRVNLHLTH